MFVCNGVPLSEDRYSLYDDGSNKLRLSAAGNKSPIIAVEIKVVLPESSCHFDSEVDLVKTLDIRPATLIAACFVIFAFGLVAEEEKRSGHETGADSCRCLQSRVKFDVSSVEKIILEPESVLSNIERFWRQDEAYQLVKKWHSNTAQPLDKEKWRRRIEVIRDLGQDQRSEHPQLVAARELAGIEQSFVTRAIPYICTFLPPEADLSTTVYFTTEIMASGFQESGKIVIHILNHQLQNLFVHEIFHRGYASIFRQYNSQPETNPVRLMRLSLHNEGIATYAGYKALSQFPDYKHDGYDQLEVDCGMLEDHREIRRLHAELNQLLRTAPQLSPEKLRPQSWELGVRQRAYYVFGAYMAQIIDQKLGRSATIETIKKGPAVCPDLQQCS